MARVVSTSLLAVAVLAVALPGCTSPPPAPSTSGSLEHAIEVAGQSLAGHPRLVWVMGHGFDLREGPNAWSLLYATEAGFREVNVTAAGTATVRAVVGPMYTAGGGSPSSVDSNHILAAAAANDVMARHVKDYPTGHVSVAFVPAFGAFPNDWGTAAARSSGASYNYAEHGVWVVSHLGTQRPVHDLATVVLDARSGEVVWADARVPMVPQVVLSLQDFRGTTTFDLPPGSQGLAGYLFAQGLDSDDVNPVQLVDPAGLVAAQTHRGRAELDLAQPQAGTWTLEAGSPLPFDSAAAELRAWVPDRLVQEA